MLDLQQHIAEVAATHPGERIDCYMLFSSHTDAMQMYAHLRTAGINARISTTPRQARSSCGVALLLQSDEALAAQQCAGEARLPYERIVALPCQINPFRDKYC